MFMVASSVVSTILILNYHHRNADTHEMSDWVIFILQNCLYNYTTNTCVFTPIQLSHRRLRHTQDCCFSSLEKRWRSRKKTNYYYARTKMLRYVYGAMMTTRRRCCFKMKYFNLSMCVFFFSSLLIQIRVVFLLWLPCILRMSRPNQEADDLEKAEKKAQQIQSVELKER